MSSEFSQVPESEGFVPGAGEEVIIGGVDLDAGDEVIVSV